MVKYTQIKKYARRIGKEFHPDSVILFGSHARKTANNDSDVDLLVVMNHDKRRNIDQAIAMRLHADAPFPMDLLVKRPRDIAERLAVNDTFLTGILQEGVILYE